MNKKQAGETLKEICPTCGKRIAPNRRPGSLTSYLFGAFDCACSEAGAVAPARPLDTGNLEDDNADFCPRCGLRIAASSEDGSLTAFLFQDTRCKCPPDQAFADGKMSDRFWKMKQAGSGTIFGSTSAGPGQSKAVSINLAPGATIGGAYTIVRLIGCGGMGEVYLANHGTLSKQCALKVIPPEQVTEIGWLRFQAEAKAVAKLEHINLVRVTDLGIHDGCLPFYAMDYVEGNNLADLVSEYGPMPLTAFLDIFLQVCDGVDCAHRNGILHRDLKPANIMVLEAAKGKRLAKVLDFGLAKLTKHDRSKQSLTAVGEIFGSPLYMSPEQCTGDKLDRRSDIYSLGCTMFECLTGKPPFSGDTAKTLMGKHLKSDPPSLETIVGKGKYPPSMEIVIAKLLRKNPVERYQTLLELRGDLAKVAKNEDVEPFYMSRTKQPQAGGQGAVLPPQSKTIPAVIPMKAILLGGAIVAAAALAAVAGLTKLASLQPKHPLAEQRSPEAASLTEDRDLAREYLKPVFNKGGPASLKDNTPFSSIVEENGKQWRVFKFPEDATIGFLTSPGMPEQPASRTVKSLVTNPLTFTPYSCAVTYPGYLKRFRTGDIAGVRISTAGNLGDLVPDLAPEGSAEAKDIGFNDYLKVASGVPGVQKVTLAMSMRRPAKIDLSLLDNYSSIKELDITDPMPNVAQLSKLQTLKKLEVLDLKVDDGVDITPILKSLKGSTHMTKLVSPHATANLDGIASAASLPQLRYLGIGELVPGTAASINQALKILSKAPKLETLRIEKSVITPEALPTLKSFRNLKALEISQYRNGMSDQDRLKLMRAATRLGLSKVLEFD